MIVFSGLTGYIGQEDDLYFWREAFNVHFLGGGSNHVIILSTPNESGEYLFHSFTFITFTSFLLNIGYNDQPKCKGNLNLFLRMELDTNHNNIKWKCILVFFLSQMLVSSHNDVLQEFQELRHEFFQKFSGNLT